MASSKNKRKKKGILRATTKALALVALLSLLTAVGISGYFYIQVRDLSIETLKGCFTTSWHQVSYCPSDPDHLRLSQPPDHLRWAVLLSEDAGFYQHQGFDWFEIHESLRRNWEERSFVRGASTISQQVAKNTLLSGERTLSRKIKEAYLTRLLERELRKHEILEIYLNIVELGGGLYGFRAASRHYFQAEPENLGPSQSAFLAALLPSPRAFQQHLESHGEVHGRHERQINRVMTRLARHNKIDLEELDLFKYRQELGLWRSFFLFPRDHEIWLQRQYADEISAYELEDLDPSSSEVDFSLDPLNGPVGEENTQEQEDSDI